MKHHPNLASPAATWTIRLEELRRRTAALRQRSRWTVEWAIYRWATEQLSSAAIRIDGSEGLSGPAPARWRLLTDIEAETGALALAVLDGRAPLLPANVVASLLSCDNEALVAIRGGGVRRWQRPSSTGDDPGDDPGEEAGSLREGVELSIDIALERGDLVLDDVTLDNVTSLPQKMALALALHERLAF